MPSPQTAPISAVLFDLDGTLVDSERESAEAMARALATGQGVEIAQDDRDFIIGRSWAAICERLRERYAQITWSRAELVAATAQAREGVFAEQGITILPGARESVARFAAIPRAIVTGSSRVEAAQALEALGLASEFDLVLAAEDYPRSKPAPDGYAAAAEALAVPIDRCLIIEDSTAGIASGLAAGGLVVAVRAGNFHGQDQSAAPVVVDTLDDITFDLLAEMAARKAG